MSDMRVEKSNNYTPMSTYHLWDKNLSYDAKGLLSMLLSEPENWDGTLEGLSKLCKDTPEMIAKTMHELEEAGYAELRQVNGESEIIVYEKPTAHTKG